MSHVFGSCQGGCIPVHPMTYDELRTYCRHDQAECNELWQLMDITMACIANESRCRSNDYTKEDMKETTRRIQDYLLRQARCGCGSSNPGLLEQPSRRRNTERSAGNELVVRGQPSRREIVVRSEPVVRTIVREEPRVRHVVVEERVRAGGSSGRSGRRRRHNISYWSDSESG
ncbi:hypothetical protein P280DRAFT_475728 [Massarina eburnea CBS 473.64]|uniref:Uncharacterized protein n=1 Tax=Massarina eburnea CBS 473.64 TaxID=1395130 RepID=A0A6A6SGJ3_9PLEO|nr:hypothetical protein P280DRAFT_475728 [Massarina eburnea CBS 473.64]